jgi:hypothetical protein
VRALVSAFPDSAVETVRQYPKNLRGLGLAENDGKRGLGARWRVTAEGLKVLAHMDQAGQAALGTRPAN